MKVLCVIDNLATGGAQRQIINLVRGLYHRGHSVSMFCYTLGTSLAQYLEREGLHVHVHLKKSRFSLEIIQGLRRHIDQGRFQAVISFLNTPNFYTILSSRLSRTRPAVVVSERFCDIPGNPNSIELAVRQLYRLSSMIVVNSNHQRKNFLHRYPWMENRVVTIYNGYDLMEFAPVPYEPINEQLHLLVVSGVARYKNGLCLILALDILREKYGLQPLVSWAGERVQSGDAKAYLMKMESEINRLGLSTQWKWLDQRTDIPELLWRHDVLIHASYGEGLPNAVCEAMACGRPVIVSDTLDHPNLVQDGINGFLFDWRSPGELARKIKEFNDLSEYERHRMGKMGRTFAETHLSLERYTNEFEELLLRLVESRSSRSSVNM